MFRALATIVLAVTAVVGGLAADDPDGSAAVATTTSDRAGDEFFLAMVELRAGADLAVMERDLALDTAAEAWARVLVARDVLDHATRLDVGVPPGWTKAGENVGRGGDVDSLWAAFLASPAHAANLADPLYTKVGIAVLVAPDGTLYTVHRFAG